MPLIVIFLVIVVFSAVILLNIYIPKYIINNALNKFVKPTLQSKGLAFVRYKWCGLLSTGNFKDNSIGITFASQNGSPMNSVYIDVIYFDNNLEKSTTVKIDTVFWFIKKVTYSNDSLNTL